MSGNGAQAAGRVGGEGERAAWRIYVLWANGCWKIIELVILDHFLY